MPVFRLRMTVVRLGSALLGLSLLASTPAAQTQPTGKALAALAPPGPDLDAMPDPAPREPRWSYRFSFGDCRDGPGERTVLGGLLGGLAGGLLGAQLADEGDEPAAAVAGALMGGLLGGAIGRAVELGDPACLSPAPRGVPTGPAPWRADQTI